MKPEPRLDPLAGLRECPWCASPPSPCSTCFECVHDVISHLLRDEDDQTVAALAVGGEAARTWRKRMREDPKELRRILSPFTHEDVVAVAGLTWALRLKAVSESRAETVIPVTIVGIGLLILFLVLNLFWRVAT